MIFLVHVPFTYASIEGELGLADYSYYFVMQAYVPVLQTLGEVVEIADPLRNYGVSASGDKAWFGWATAPQVESLREEFLMAPTEEKRKSIAEQLQKSMLQEGVTVPLGQIITASAYRKVLTGVLDTPAPIFWNIKKTGK